MGVPSPDRRGRKAEWGSAVCAGEGGVEFCSSLRDVAEVIDDLGDHTVILGKERVGVTC